MKALATNAFTQDWNQWSRVYMFPPTNMLLRVLSHLESFKGMALLVAPVWPNQNWYPLLLARAKRRLILPNPKLFQKVGADIFWNRSKVLENLACWVC